MAVPEGPEQGFGLRQPCWARTLTPGLGELRAHSRRHLNTAAGRTLDGSDDLGIVLGEVMKRAGLRFAGGQTGHPKLTKFSATSSSATRPTDHPIYDGTPCG